MTDGDRLRQLLGDTIPHGGSETDCFFGSDQISDLLLNSNGNLERAAVEGWRVKAADYADLVNITEGNAMREMSALHAHALAQVKYYERTTSGNSSGRTRIGHIVRRWY